MKKYLTVCLLMLPLLMVAQQNEAYLKYIKQYKKIALAQEKEHKIPACITLAQGLLESAAGQSELAREGNNHFGIKCHSGWTGETITHDDETAGECFRKYAKAEESYEDHSAFLLRSRYASLFELPITDYKGWAHGLKRCGYATDPGYAAKLIKIIEDYDLASVTTAELSNQDGSAEDLLEEETAEQKSAPAISEKKNKDKKGKASDKEKEQLVANAIKAAGTENKPKESDKKSNPIGEQKNKKTKPAQQETVTPVEVAPATSENTAAPQVASVVEDEKIGKPASMGTVELFSEHKVYKDRLVRWVKAERGDTYEAIAVEFNMEASRLRKYNNAEKNAQPQEGQRVYLTKKH